MAIIVTLEVLSHKSSVNGNGGGIAFADDIDSLSTLTVFGYFDKISLVVSS